MSVFRVGHGYDVHKLVEGRKLVLGGVTVPHTKGLLGHSDADVLLHAVMDALLGAVALGDIGRHFPDSDMAYKDASSLLLLGKVAELLWKRGAKIVNIDATIVLQRPKIATFIPKMVENIASTLDIPTSAVNVKATTEEHLGFTGSEAGASAHAVAMVEII